MQLRDIETFMAVMKHKNLSQAAQSLYITQPTLTRRIKILEDEIGYQLFDRKKGVRVVTLTEKGADFSKVAGRWQQLLEETARLLSESEKRVLSIGTVASVERPYLAQVLPALSGGEICFRVYNILSEEVYYHMSMNMLDLALVSQQDYTHIIPPGVQTKVAFQEGYLLVSRSEIPNTNGLVDCKDISVYNEVLCSWDMDFKRWHKELFGADAVPYVMLETGHMFESFIDEDRWMILPFGMARSLDKTIYKTYYIKNPPPDRYIYYVLRNHNNDDRVRVLLDQIDAILNTMPRNMVRSYLS